MKAIIYTQLSAANAALETCTANIAQGEIRQEGTGRFAEELPDVPYTIIIKHPTLAKWALVADQQVEAELGMTAEELDDTWFPKSLFSNL